MDNILLNGDGRCHISDFGSAHRFGGHPGEAELLRDTVGTFHFLAPECLTGEPYVCSLARSLYFYLLTYLLTYCEHRCFFFHVVNKDLFQ